MLQLQQVGSAHFRRPLVAVRLLAELSRPMAVACLLLLLLLSTATLAHARTVKLNKGWRFLVDEKGALKVGEIDGARGWRDVRVGLSWNAQFEDLRDYMGVAWYRNSFEAPERKGSERVLIRFGAVDYFSEVYLNGERIGEHEGGYTPFSFDLTERLKPGRNELVVRVIDPPMNEDENRSRFPRWMYNEIPHGKQNWYVQTGGIWQDVALDVRPPLYIEQVHISPRPDGRFSLDLKLAGSPAGRSMSFVVLEIEVDDPGGKVVYQRKLLTSAAEQHLYQGRIDGAPRLWAPSDPALYTVKIRAGLTEPKKGLSGALPLEEVQERFGFRSFEARDGHFYLNGEPFYMMGALDQDFYPEGIYTPPSEEFVRDEMMKAKRLGLNLLRCHIKVPDPVYLKAADEVGMLIWYEIPSWNDFHHFTPEAAARGERIFTEQVARDWNHPSIVIQSIINETWGADLRQAEQRRWLRAAFERAKSLTAPLGRLIVDNSACCDGFHLKSDVDDFHQYFSIPDRREDWDKWVAEFASRPAWSFSQHGDAERTRTEPLVVSEFGNWGLPRLPKDLPWWFGRDFGGREVTRPGGLYERFREFRFNRLFRDYDELAQETEWHQFISLKHEIEEMRRHSSIQGYVITEFTDINWEVNGLLDMWRNPKVYAEELARIQQPDLVFARLPKRNYTGGELVKADVLFSHYGPTDLKSGTLVWATDASAHGEVKFNRSIKRAEVASLESISFLAPYVDRPRPVKLWVGIGAPGVKAPLSENSFEIFVYPKRAAVHDVSLLFYDPSNRAGGLTHALTAAGYKVSEFKPAASVGSSALVIATVLDAQVERHLQGGGRALVLADSKEAVPAGAPLQVVPREGSDLDGNWVTNFNWAKITVAPFNEVAFGRVLGFESERTIPRYVIRGLKGSDYDDVLSGIFYGWLNHNAALAVQMNAGTGKLLLTTFRFEAYGEDPYATRLLDAMIRYTGERSFAPKLNWPL